jgi:hypothetical protein
MKKECIHARHSIFVCGQLLYLVFLLFALATGIVGNLRAPTTFLHECLFSEKRSNCDLTNILRDHLCGSVWGLLFLAGNTSAFWGLLFLTENTSGFWGLLFLAGYFCFLRVTLPGRDFFCLRMVFPASGAEDSKKPWHSEVFAARKGLLGIILFLAGNYSAFWWLLFLAGNTSAFWGLLFLAGNTSAFWGLLLLPGNTSAFWGLLFLAGILLP